MKTLALVVYSARSQIALFDAPFGLQLRQTQKMCWAALKAASAHFFRLPRFAPKRTAKNAQFVTALSMALGLCVVSLGESPLMKISEKKFTKEKMVETKAKEGRIQRLFGWVRLPWVDIREKSNEKDSAGLVIEFDKDNKGAVSQKNSMTGRGPAKVPDMSYKPKGGISIEFDDNAPKGMSDKGDKSGENSESISANHKGPVSKVRGGGKNGKPQTFEHLWPMCVFVDPSLGNVNSLIKSMVDMAADCEVNLAVYPFYVKSKNKNAQDVVESSREKCNAVTGLGQFGVNRASVVNLVNSKKLPLQMCRASGVNTRDLSFCSEFGFDPGDGVKQRLANQGKWGGVAGAGKTAVSIVGPDGLNVATVNGAAFGQPQMGLLPGVGAGNGYGFYEEGYASAGAAPQRGWSEPGCQRMRQASFKNVINWKYNPDQELYLVPGNNSRYLDLNGDKTVFLDPSRARKSEDLGDSAAGSGSSSPAIISRSQNQSVENRSKEGSASSGSDTSLDGGHKKKVEALIQKDNKGEELKDESRQKLVDNLFPSEKTDEKWKNNPTEKEDQKQRRPVSQEKDPGVASTGGDDSVKVFSLRKKGR